MLLMALDPILKFATRIHRQLPDDLVSATWNIGLASERDDIANSEFVRH